MVVAGECDNRIKVGVSPWDHQLDSSTPNAPGMKEAMQSSVGFKRAWRAGECDNRIKVRVSPCDRQLDSSAPGAPLSGIKRAWRAILVQSFK